MLISFFEEFPTKSNLAKLKLIKFPTKLYLGAKSLIEFQQLKSQIKNQQVKEFVYWPLLAVKEGYWVSPFTQRKALLRIFDELKNTGTPVMLDLELPTTKNPLLYFSQSANFFRNQLLIRKFIKQHPGKVYLAEYYPEGKLNEKTLQLLGLHYQNKKAKVIKMVYHSMHHFDEDFIKKQFHIGKKEYQNNYLVAYGTIAKGIAGWEPILSPTQLKKDLQLAREARIPEVVLYRLGGLNQQYLNIIKQF